MPRTLTDHASQGSDSIRPHAAAVEVVSCDGSDTTPIVLAAQGIRAALRQAGSAEVWFEQATRLLTDPTAEPADVVVLVASAERMVQQRWVARASAAASNSVLVAALVDSTLDHAMSAVGQGARGLLALPNSSERLTHHLREVVDRAAKTQSERLAVFRHRRGLASLTPAENDVLEGMLAGMPNKQIAQRLSIGLRTVELRRSKIMKKMRAKSLAQLISYIGFAQRHGC